jgi:S-adenosylmethionine-diacylgycerolhomoserine-N-methlytransferase
MTAAPTTTHSDHSRLMDRVYRRQRHIYDLTRKYYLLGRDRMIYGLDIAEGQSLLEVGCGTGRNLMVVSKHYPMTRLFGLDISSEMLATARGKLAGLPNEVTLRELDASRFVPADFDEAGFDRIMISYALSASRRACRAGSARCCAAGSGNSTSRRGPISNRLCVR